jgi:hypothetical protein
MIGEWLTRQQLFLIHSDAKFVAERVGGVNAPIRDLARWTLQLLEERKRLIETCNVARDALEGCNLKASVHEALERLDAVPRAP